MPAEQVTPAVRMHLLLLADVKGVDDVDLHARITRTVFGQAKFCTPASSLQTKKVEGMRYDGEHLSMVLR